MIDEMWMIRPHCRSFMDGTSARVSAMHELRFSSTSLSQSSSRIWSIGWGMLLPALLTRMSTRPIASMAACGQLVGLVAMAHVGDDVLDPGRRGGPDLAGGGLKLVLVPAGDDDVGAGLGEAPGHGLAQALASPGHESRSTRQIKEFCRHPGFLRSRLKRPRTAVSIACRLYAIDREKRSHRPWP